MRTKWDEGRTYFFLLTFLTISACLSAQERIEWEPVAGADHYLVEIRQNGKLVFEIRSEEPFIPLFLPPGGYDFQIKVVDALGNTRSTSEFSRLRISTPLTPFIIDLSPRIIHERAVPKFFARVSGLLEDEERSTNFALENGEGDKIQLIWKASDSSKPSEGWMEISLSAGKKLPNAGIWHLIMTNPDGREDRFENALTIFEGSRPRIISINPKGFVAGIPNAVLRVSAKGFGGDADLQIDGPSEIPITKLNQGEKGVFEFSLNLKDASKGHYSVLLANPSGEIDTGVRRLRIRSPKTASPGKVKTLKVDDGNPRPFSEFPNAIYAGWRPLMQIDSPNIEPPFEVGAVIGTDIAFQPRFLGFTLGYSRDIKNDLLRRVPYLDGLEWYLSANYAQNKLVDRPNNLPITEEFGFQQHHNLFFLFGISYTTWFNFPLNVLAQVGLGVGVTLREYIGAEPIPAPPLEIPFNDEAFNPKNSTSLIMSFDFGLCWDITPRLFINATANTMIRNEISGSNENSLQPKIEGGWRW